jgi:hypothetical protein
MHRLVEDLRRARDHARSRATVLRRFGFGARHLVIHATPGDADVMPDGNLVEVEASLDGVGLCLIDRTATESLRFPDVALSAYGAIRQSLTTDWVVLRNPDTGRVLALDTAERSALYYPGDPLPPRDRAEFCRPLLHWLAVGDGNVVLHAGAVARHGRALIVAGAGNAGKTTLIRACLDAGFAMLGDNVVEVTRAEHGPSRVLGVYPTVKVRPDPVVPAAADWPAPEWDAEASKHIYSLAGSLGTGFTAEPQGIAGLLVLDPAAPPIPEVLPLAAAMFKVAPNTVGQFPLFEEEVLRRTGAVLGRLPIHTVGQMPATDIAPMVESLLEMPRDVPRGGSDFGR